MYLFVCVCVYVSVCVLVCLFHHCVCGCMPQCVLPFSSASLGAELSYRFSGDLHVTLYNLKKYTRKI